jgi:hypothetical protein
LTEINQIKTGYFEERHAAWKLLLPIMPDLPVLSIGIDRYSLLNMCRSWKKIHTFRCQENELKWIEQNADNLGLNVQLTTIDGGLSTDLNYHAIVVNAKYLYREDEKVLLGHLQPGGSIAFIGEKAHVPSKKSLLRAGYESARNYAILPPNTNKVMIALRDSAVVKKGLNLYIPNIWYHRILGNCCKFVASAHCHSLLGLKQVVIARRHGLFSNKAYLLDWLSNNLNHHIADVTIYPGTNQAPGRRKVTLQLFDDEGQVVGIAKIADSYPAILAIETETLALKKFENIRDMRKSVPRILFTGQWQGHAVQVQSNMDLYYKKHSKNLTPSHLTFLRVLHSIERQDMKIEQWPLWKKLLHWAYEGDSSAGKDNEAARDAIKYYKSQLAELKVPFCNIHGDFTPWNCFCEKDQAIVIDWEDADSSGLPLYDLVHFSLRKQWHLNKKRVSLETMLSETSKIFGFEHDFDSYASMVYFKNIPAEQKKDFLKKILILCYAQECMRTVAGSPDNLKSEALK